MISLNAEDIAKNIVDEKLKSTIKIYILQEVDSTNCFLKNIVSIQNHAEVRDVKPKDYLTICCSERQTKGRGRRGKSWFSPFGENIYLSMLWTIATPNNMLEQLSIVVGLSIIKALAKIGISKNMQIKWPNDIYYKDKKLAGILTEVIHKPHNPLNIISGIGINVNSDFNEEKFTDNWTSLFNITNKKYDRNQIIAIIINEINDNIKVLINNGFNFFFDLWKDYDYLYNKSINVLSIGKSIQGISKGINHRGELRVLCTNDEVIFLQSGEVSLNTI